jgi:hypothetical protein
MVYLADNKINEKFNIKSKKSKCGVGRGKNYLRFVFRDEEGFIIHKPLTTIFPKIE